MGTLRAVGAQLTDAPYIDRRPRPADLLPGRACMGHARPLALSDQIALELLNSTDHVLDVRPGTSK
jgi:hypothetical protein